MTHAEMDELYDLYALGALEPEFASQIDQHVADQCEYCVKHIHRSVNATAMLSALVDPLEPPKNVRRRLMTSLRPAKAAHGWKFTLPLLAIACTVLLAVGVWSSAELFRTRHDLEQVAGERQQLKEALLVLSRSQPKLVQFGTSNRPVHGGVFVNRNGGFVMIGSELPRISTEKAFELWLIPAGASPKPIPAGVFRTTAGNDFVHVYQEPIDTSKIAAVAVTVEPKEGSLAPTTKPFLVVPLG